MPPSPADLALAARIEATFGTAAPMIRRFALLAAGLMVFAFLANTAKMVVEINAPGFDGQAIQIDFTSFWAAAKLGLAGDAASAFNVDLLRDAQQLPSDNSSGDILWHYPPGWHILILPLGLMPFSVAFIVYSVLVFAIFAFVLRPLAAPVPGGVALVLAAPSVMAIMNLGNNSLLWIAGLAAAITAMARGRAVLAGLLIGLLTLKPQLGILIPFALAFGGYWRTVLWACIGTALVALLSTAIIGLDYWYHFVAMLRLVSDLMKTELVQFDLMMTWYALARFAGAGHALAFPLQLACSAAAAAAVAWVWSRPAASIDIKAATLFIVIPLATPYAYHYEMAQTLAGALFLVRDGFGANRVERAWLLALWLGSVPGLALDGIFPTVIYAPPLLTATVGLCIWRAAKPSVRPGSPAAQFQVASTRH
jgi:hypothetical protein